MIVIIVIIMIIITIIIMIKTTNMISTNIIHTITNITIIITMFR